MNKIRTRITIFVVANSLLIILVLFILNYFSVAKPLTQEYRQRGNVAAKKLSNRLNHWIELKEFGIERIIHAIEVYEKIDIDLFTKIIRNAQMVSADRSSRKPYICFDGNVWVDGEGWVPPADYVCKNRPWYKGATKRNKHFYISEIYVDAQTSEPIFTISHPLKLKNGTFGVLGHDFNVNGFTDIVNRFKTMKNSYAFLVDNNSNIITHPNKDYLFDKKRGYTKVDNILEGKLKNAWKDIDLPIEERTITDYDNKKRVFFFSPIRSYNGKIVLAVAYDEIMAPINKSIFLSLASVGIVLFVAIFFAFRLSSSIGKPILEIAKTADKIAELDFNAKISTSLLSRGDEIGKLTQSFNGMRKGLLNFKKYVPSDLVNQLIKNNQDATIGGERKELTMFFSDIANFTNICEKVPPEEVSKQLSKYFSQISENILDNKGTVDKYIGDSIMAFWGAPNKLDNHAYLACKSALECNKLIKDLCNKCKQDKSPIFETRIGINTGEVIVGNMGYEKRIDYTVVGDNVNLASRLENINKYYETQIIISHNTYKAVKDHFECRILDKIAVKGKEDSIMIYELLANIGELSKEDLEIYAIYNRGIEHYFNGNWQEAIKQMDLVLEQKSDHCADIIKQRSQKYQKNPPKNWDGVFVFSKKIENYYYLSV